MTKTSGFTPIFDIVVKETKDYITASVFGYIWRNSKLSKGMCTSAIKTIAEKLGLSYSSVQRRLDHLMKDGWIEDLTPGLKNRPHNYRPLVKIDIIVSAKSQGISTRSERTSGSVTVTDEDTIKKQEDIKIKPMTKAQLYTKELEALENLFSTETGIPYDIEKDWDTDPRGMNKLWRMPMRKMYKMTGDSKKDTRRLMGKAIKKMRKNNPPLDIASPKSILSVFTSLYGLSQTQKDELSGRKEL